MWKTRDKFIDIGPAVLVHTTEKIWRFITAKEAREKTDEKIAKEKELALNFLPMIEEKILEALNSADVKELASFIIPEGTSHFTCVGLYDLLVEAGYKVIACGSFGYCAPVTCKGMAISGNWMIEW